jgi:nucleotidyltransferase/DNA polymerase involved in DNA repair
MIIHLDADAFYVSVEQVQRPELKGRPVAVGGEKRGIIASASYEARLRGVYTPMPTARARRICPDLVLIPSDMARYQQVSRAMFALCEAAAPIVEQSSIDEGYLDVSSVRSASAFDIAANLKARILQNLGIRVSLGIGSNKLISQIASKLHKPDALYEVPRGTEREFLAPLDVQWLPGVGPKLAERLRAAGLLRVADVAAAPLESLSALAGSMAARLKGYSTGLDERPVEPVHDDPKSYGMQETFAEDVGDPDRILAFLRAMAADLMYRVRMDRKAIRTVTVRVRHPDFSEASHGMTLAASTFLETDLFPHLERLLAGAWKARAPLRLVSLRLSNIEDAPQQIDLDLDHASGRRQKQAAAAKVLDALRAKSLPVKRGNALG